MTDARAMRKERALQIRVASLEFLRAHGTFGVPGCGARLHAEIGQFFLCHWTPFDNPLRSLVAELRADQEPGEGLSSYEKHLSAMMHARIVDERSLRAKLFSLTVSRPPRGLLRIEWSGITDIRIPQFKRGAWEMELLELMSPPS
jgi:hypothetical protein